MATDPAVQTAAEAIHAATHTHSHLDRFGATDSDRQIAEIMLIAVTPLIRAQAFTEAEQAIRSLMDRQPLFDERDTWAHDVYGEALRAVRGLGEETENA